MQRVGLDRKGCVLLSAGLLGGVLLLNYFIALPRRGGVKSSPITPSWENAAEYSPSGVDCGVRADLVVVTFVHNDEKYVDSANRLALSLGEHGPSLERIAMVLSELEGLKGWKQCKVGAVNNHVKNLVEAWDNILTKLEVLRIEGGIGKAVYVDADCLAGPRIMELFNVKLAKNTIAANRAFEDNTYLAYMNAGVMVFQPSSYLFHQVVDNQKINETSTDQDMLWNAINYGKIIWKYLEIGLVLSRAEIGLFKNYPFGVCHWAGFDKPWTGCVDRDDPMCKAWNKYGTMV